jgi:hypothetical protein
MMNLGENLFYCKGHPILLPPHNGQSGVRLYMRKVVYTLKKVPLADKHEHLKEATQMKKETSFLILSIVLSVSITLLLLPLSPSKAGTKPSNVFPETGNVGIGTPTPNTKLHIDATGVDNDGSTAVVRIISGNGSQHLLLDGNEIDATTDGLFLNNNTNQKVVLATGGGNVGIGAENPVAKLDIAGTTRTGVLQITGGSDLAELFEIAAKESVKPGMVVAIDPANLGQLRLADKAYDRMVAGIISGANGLTPGLTMTQTERTVEGTLPVALTGRVYSWADASNGPIQPGDLLTTSDLPGHAMKVTDYARAQGAIIGKAMSSLETGRGSVLVLVTLQ